MNAYRELMRRKLLEQMYDRMSEEEKRAFVQLTMQDRNHSEIMDALQNLERKADSNHHSFLSDFAANIAGNGVWDGLVWIGSRLLRKL